MYSKLQLTNHLELHGGSRSWQRIMLLSLRSGRWVHKRFTSILREDGLSRMPACWPCAISTRRIGFLAGLAERWPDPRSQAYVQHSTEALLVQQVYQILGGYADWNDAQPLRDDPLFRTLVGIAPDQERGLASGSTLARFHHAYTRRDAELPPEERPVLLEQQQAQCQRIKLGNAYLVETFRRTRRRQPGVLILDRDATDDATHGAQVLSGYHGYFGQHQYFPLLVYEGVSGFPLGGVAATGDGACQLRCGRHVAGTGGPVAAGLSRDVHPGPWRHGLRRPGDVRVL